ncbi:hypothetical protein BC829DRAFT_399261 [Chytridium lagenaria]|nr:hypothetical protein BC829DRAFT_399261 [Chytridium lagenaria]
MVEYTIKELEAKRDLSRIIVHVDMGMAMDAFYCAVEQLERPDLKDKAFAVGGTGQSGVLCTANYVARQKGVRSAQGCHIARELCPELIILPTNFRKYQAFSEKIMKILKRYDPKMHAASVDEAYLDITDVVVSSGRPADHLVQDMRSEIFVTTGLTASAGIAANKMLAKFSLPCDRQAILDFLKTLNVRKISGIGRFEDVLEKLKDVAKELAEDLDLEDLLVSLLSFVHHLLSLFRARTFGFDLSSYEDLCLYGEELIFITHTNLSEAQTVLSLRTPTTKLQQLFLKQEQKHEMKMERDVKVEQDDEVLEVECPICLKKILGRLIADIEPHIELCLMKESREKTSTKRKHDEGRTVKEEPPPKIVLPVSDVCPICGVNMDLTPDHSSAQHVSDCLVRWAQSFPQLSGVQAKQDLDAVIFSIRRGEFGRDVSRVVDDAEGKRELMLFQSDEKKGGERRGRGRDDEEGVYPLDIECPVCKAVVVVNSGAEIERHVENCLLKQERRTKKNTVKAPSKHAHKQPNRKIASTSSSFSQPKKSNGDARIPVTRSFETVVRGKETTSEIFRRKEGWECESECCGWREGCGENCLESVDIDVEQVMVDETAELPILIPDDDDLLDDGGRCRSLSPTEPSTTPVSGSEIPPEVIKPLANVDVDTAEDVVMDVHVEKDEAERLSRTGDDDADPSSVDPALLFSPSKILSEDGRVGVAEHVVECVGERGEGGGEREGDPELLFFTREDEEEEEEDGMDGG